MHEESGQGGVAEGEGVGGDAGVPEAMRPPATRGPFVRLTHDDGTVSYVRASLIRAITPIGKRCVVTLVSDVTHCEEGALELMDAIEAVEGGGSL
jgi:hypothetical protein